MNWCSYLQIMIECNLNCSSCKNNPYVIRAKEDIYFNYECPNCHGKFNTLASEETGETKLVDIKEIGTPTIVIAQQVQPILRYKCPFCGIEMKGLNK